MPQFIISANYRDYGSELRWLVRPIGQLASQSIAVRSIKARNVRFVASEDLAGCSMEATAEEATWNDLDEALAPIGRPIFFDVEKLEFFDSTTHENVTDRTCEELYLHADGSVFAVLRPAEEPQPA